MRNFYAAANALFSHCKIVSEFIIRLLDVDVDGIYERRTRPVCPPHPITSLFNYFIIIIIIIKFIVRLLIEEHIGALQESLTVGNSNQ